MITPLSRGSSLAEFDDFNIDEFGGLQDDGLSDYTEIDDFFISETDSSLTKISDSSVWTTSKLISENNSIHHGPIEPLHMDYIIR